MKRFLLITLDYPPMRGGVARYLSEMAAYFGDRMEVVAHGLLFSAWWPKWLRAFFPLLRRRNTYDILMVSHLLPLGLVALIQKKMFGKPYVLVMHGMDFALARRNGWKRAQSKRITREAKLVITNTENLAREVLGFVRPADIDVIYPCLSAELVGEAKRFARDESIGLHDRDHTVRFLTVARLVARKGHLNVLEALARLVSEHRLGPFVYTVLGSGPCEGELRARADELGLSQQVRFVTNATDAELIQHYKEADVFVMPTEHRGRDIEGFGTVYVEAAAFGLPAIASDLPGVDEAVLHEETGLLVPASSVEDLALALERLAADPALRLRLGNNGKMRALEEFVAARQFAKLDELL